MKILVLNGANLNLLGQREPKLYGSKSLDTLEKEVNKKFGQSVICTWQQSNLEGELVEMIQSSVSFDGLVVNMGGFSHTSVAIHDALGSLSIPKVEVHISNVYKREKFRQTMITAASCDCVISGGGSFAYQTAIYHVKNIVENS